VPKAEGFGRPTSKDVARMAGVSQSTVSYALSGRRPISRATKKRVDDAVEALGFHLNARGKALVSQKSGVIALLVPQCYGVDAASRMPFIDEISRTSYLHGYDLLIVSGDRGSREVSRLVGEARCDGLILMEVRDEDDRTAAVKATNAPCVLIGVPEDHAGLTCVDLDYEAAARLCVNEAARTGHEAIALQFFSSPSGQAQWNYVSRFVEVATEAAQQQGLAVSTHEIPSSERQAIQVALKEAMQDAAEHKTLLVPLNVSDLAFVCQSLGQEGWRPGSNMSMIAVVSNQIAESCYPQVTNVSNEARDVSRWAVELLVQDLGSETANSSESEATVHLVEPCLVSRESVRNWRDIQREIS